MTDLIGPGSTIGILGAGQLGRMLALVARRMGYRVAIFGGDRNSPAGQVSDLVWPGDYQDLDALSEFAAASDVVTYEFENVPSEAAARIADVTPLRPNARLLKTAQNRFTEKTALSKIGLATAEFRMVHSAAELKQARDDFGGSVILKANTDGYDGKGQWSIEPDSDIDQLWHETGLPEAIVEQKVQFEFELSIIAGRYADGTMSFFEPVLNHHASHILDVSISGAPEVTETMATQATEIARAILEYFDVIGVLCVELFLTTDGNLVVNEIAPRTHNSGHLTIEAYNCSQFELQMRTVCGLPSVSLIRQTPCAAMANLLGRHLPDTWTSQTAACLEQVRTYLHLYGKASARTNRKVGHITVLGEVPATAEHLARSARAALSR